MIGKNVIKFVQCEVWNESNKAPFRLAARARALN